MDTQGGRLQITIGGTTFDCRGKCSVKPAGVQVEAGANWSGKGYKTVKPVLAQCDLSFDRGKGIAWDSNFLLADEDVTIAEIDANVTHYFTAAAKVGTPSIDTETGEVSGVTLQSDKYRQART